MSFGLLAASALAMMDNHAMDMSDGANNHSTMNMGCGNLTCSSSTAFIAENMQMHDAMAIHFACDAEADFVRGMIPHHQGASIMCEVLRNYTSGMTVDMGSMGSMDHGSMDMGRRLAMDMMLDPFLDKLCTNITREQDKEIDMMRDWLANNGHVEDLSCEGVPPIEHMGMRMGCGNASCASTHAFLRENMQMHDAMAIHFTCDAEADFVRGMIPHHQGASIMCEVLRNYTSGMTMDMGSMGSMDHGSMDMGRRLAMDTMALDPFLDELCTNITREQDKEIDMMRDWLANNGHVEDLPCSSPPGAPPPQAPSPSLPPAAPSPQAPPAQSGLGAGVIAGIVVGAVVGLGAVLIGIALMMNAKKAVSPSPGVSAKTMQVKPAAP